MSLNSVKLFYERLSADKNFSDRIQKASNKNECTQIVQAAGYDFTQQEFEDYTEQLLEADPNNSELESLNERELEAVFGGIGDPVIRPVYGLASPENNWAPIYTPVYGSPSPDTNYA